MGRMTLILPGLRLAYFLANLLYREDKADNPEVVRHRDAPGYRGVISFTS